MSLQKEKELTHCSLFLYLFGSATGSGVKLSGGPPSNQVSSLSGGPNLHEGRGEYNQFGSTEIDGKHTWMAYQTPGDDFVMTKLH